VRYGHCKDVLWKAMQLLEQYHEVKYFDFPLKGIFEFKPDVVLYWEAPCTIKGKDAENYNSVCALPFKKCLLFAGGELKADWVKDFDHVFVESMINEEDCDRQDIPFSRAFGVNTDIFKPKKENVMYDAFLPATFAEWKRHELFAIVGDRGCCAGRVQEFDKNGYNACIKANVNVLPEQSPEDVSKLINQSYCVLNTSSFWGGGQRATLEAMACGVPVIVMSDSPKNVEYVKESGGGIICDPDKESILKAIDIIKDNKTYGTKGLEYVLNNWTEYHYATAIINVIKDL
jgi:hypothetical protein